jgi:hypothetical protein
MPESFKLSHEHTQKATLGCGTLILIALIVAIFSNHGADDIDRGLVESLRNDVKELKKSIDAQSQEIRDLRQALKKAEPAKKTAEAMPENPFDLEKPQQKSRP